MSLEPSSYEERLKRARKNDQWRRESAKKYEDRLREEGQKFSDMKRTGGPRPVDPERREENHERAYGGEARVRWVKTLDCLVPGCELPAESAHLPGAGGMGYKGDADETVNACHRHHRDGYEGSMHDLGSIEAFNERWGVDLRAAAERLEERWKRKQSSD